MCEKYTALNDYFTNYIFLYSANDVSLSQYIMIGSIPQNQVFLIIYIHSFVGTIEESIDRVLQWVATFSGCIDKSDSW
jgi:hypothetical protein